MEHHPHHQPHLLHHNHFPFGPPPPTSNGHHHIHHHDQQLLDLDMFNGINDDNSTSELNDDDQFRSRANTWPVNRIVEHSQQPNGGNSGGAPSDESKNSTPLLDAGRGGAEKLLFDNIKEEEDDHFDENGGIGLDVDDISNNIKQEDEEDDGDDDDDDEDDVNNAMLTDDMKPPSANGTSAAVVSAKPASGAKKKCGTRRNAWGNQSYADLITQAIMSTPDSRLTLAQIYEWMTQNLPYFRDKADSNSSAGWKNSIRHNLSLHNKFIRLQNEGTGKSSWWTLNPNARPGKATRRRAASMDTKTYEKRRGRVKKRLDVGRAVAGANGLHGSPSSSVTDSSSTTAAHKSNPTSGGGLLSAAMSESSLYPPSSTGPTAADPTVTNNSSTAVSTNGTSTFRTRSGSSASSCNSRRGSSPFVTSGVHANHHHQPHTGSSSVTSTTDLLPPMSDCQASTTTASWDLAQSIAAGQHPYNNRYDSYQNDQYLTQTLAGTMKLNGGGSLTPSDSSADLHHLNKHYPQLQQHRNSVGGYITASSGAYGLVAGRQQPNRAFQQSNSNYAQQRHNSLSIPVGNPQQNSHMKQQLQQAPYGSSMPNHASLLSSPGHHFQSAYQNGGAYGREFNSITDKLRATLVSKQQQQQHLQQQQPQQQQHNPFGGGVCIPYNGHQQPNFARNYSQQNGFHSGGGIIAAAKTSPASTTTLLASPSATASPQSTTLSPHHTPSPLTAAGAAATHGGFLNGRAGYPCSMSPSQFYTTAGAPSSSMSSSIASSSVPSSNGSTSSSSAYLPADLQSIDIQPLGMFDEHMQFMQNDLRDGGLIDFNGHFSNNNGSHQPNPNGMVGISNGTRI